MTEQTQPTDAELEAAWTDATGSSILPYPGEMLAFARAVLAKWGTPAGAGEPYAYAVYFPDQPCEELVHDLDDLCEDLTNREHVITKLYTTPQPTQAQTREPLTVQYPEGYGNPLAKIAYDAGWRAAERAHGIKGADHG